MKELLKALSDAKKEIGAITKNEENPFFKSKYFDINALIEHVEPVLESHGLLLLQPLTEGKVLTQIFHVETSQVISSYMALPELMDPQKMGSAITYYRRYTLQSLLALQSEDNDGNGATLPVLNIGEPKWVSAIEKRTPLITVKKYYFLSKANSDEYLRQLNQSK